jgi:O-antigen/teichoic acid export membrane protein
VSDPERIVANTSYRVVAEIASKLISIAFYVVLAREVGDEGFGVFTFGLAFVMLVTTLAIFGQDAIFIREVAPRRELIDRYFANTLALKLALAVPALAVAIAVSSAVGMDAETRLVIAILGAAVTVEALMTTSFAAFQSFDRLGFIPIVLVCQRLVMTAVGIPVLVLGGGVVAASAVYLGGALTALAVSLLFVFRYVVRPHFRARPGEWWSLMRAAWPVGVGTVFSTTLFRVDAAILALLATDAVVGDYGAAYRLFEATLFLSWSVGAAVYPVFSRLTAAEAPLRDVRERGLKLVIAPTLPLAVGALVFGTPLITLIYGREFEEGGAALVLLAPAIALYPVEYVLVGMLIAQRRQHAVAVAQALVAAENIAANLVLIPFLSLKAAALNTSVSELLLVISMLVLARPLAGAVDWRRVATGPVLAAGLAGAVMVALRHQLALAIPVGALLYLAALTTWERRAFPEDARAVSDFLLRRA